MYINKIQIVVFDEVCILFHFNIILKHNGMSSTKMNTNQFIFCLHNVTFASAHREGTWGRGVMASFIQNVNTRWRRVLSFKTGRTMALGLTQLLTEMSTRNIF